MTMSEIENFHAHVYYDLPTRTQAGGSTYVSAPTVATSVSAPWRDCR